MKKGLLVVLSGPSGSGKSTVTGHLRKLIPELGFSVSATSRKSRPGEIDGVDYHFVSAEEFEQMIERGEITEYTRYCDNYYGTPKSEVEKALTSGADIILEIEVEGALRIKQLFPDDSLSVMILPPDAAELERRLRKRGTESDEVIKSRLSRMRKEMEYAPDYDYVVVNGDSYEQCAQEIAEIVRSARRTTERQSDFIEAFVKGLPE